MWSWTQRGRAPCGVPCLPMHGIVDLSEQDEIAGDDSREFVLKAAARTTMWRRPRYRVRLL